MKTKLFLIILLFTFHLISTSCSSIADATTKGESFYNMIKNKQFNQIPLILDEQAYVLTKKENWISGIENIYTERGNLISFEKTGIYTTVENDFTIIRLDYLVVYDNGTFSEQLRFIEKNEVHKIFEYNFNVKKEPKN